MTDRQQDDADTFGIALGFRTLEERDQYFLVEAEIAPYVDAPGELGATIVFHPLEGLDPTAESEEIDWPSWPIDIDDDLERDPSQPLPAQFQAIVRQLHSLSTDRLLEYLGIARADATE